MRCKSQGIIPKGVFVKTPFSSPRSSRIAQRASTSLLRDRMHFHCNNKATLLRKINQLKDFLRSSVSNSDQQRIFKAKESSFSNIFNKQKATHIRKFSLLNNQQNKVISITTSASKNQSSVFPITSSQTPRKQSF
jgi:hypothetical protein